MSTEISAKEWEEMKETFKNLTGVAEGSQKMALELQAASDDLIVTIKNIHLALSANLHKLNDCPDLVDLNKQLGIFIMSPIAIEAGIRAHARKK